MEGSASPSPAPAPVVSLGADPMHGDTVYAEPAPRVDEGVPPFPAVLLADGQIPVCGGAFATALTLGDDTISVWVQDQTNASIFELELTPKDIAEICAASGAPVPALRQVRIFHSLMVSALKAEAGDEAARRAFADGPHDRTTVGCVCELKEIKGTPQFAIGIRLKSGGGMMAMEFPFDVAVPLTREAGENAKFAMSQATMKTQFDQRVQELERQTEQMRRQLAAIELQMKGGQAPAPRLTEAPPDDDEDEEGHDQRLWYCAIRHTGGDIVLKKSFSLARAQAALNVGHAMNQQAIIPVSAAVVAAGGLSIPINSVGSPLGGDPHTLPKTWAGGSMWWMDWGEINAMRAKCATEAPPDDDD